jgi:hypothetical protein
MNGPEGAGRGQRPECLCLGLGPQLTALLRALGPSDEVTSHLRAAQVEILKAVRVLIDQRIASLSAQESSGQRVPVE